ncbi:hypothetical protein ACFONC_11595 [Luteimonas soli]|uniref:Sialate O-acetylesterase domain-containing protein n=1 Tax=Luteimonas soli TaxID=1648966 RepID=A0ABV7XL70_9GAMM
MTDDISPINGKALRAMEFVEDADGLEVYGVKNGRDYRAIVGAPGGVATHDDLKTIELAQASGSIGFATKAALDADLAHAAGALAVVTNDSTATNNGTYRKTGASGSGSWVQSADRVTVLEGNLGTLADADATLARDLQAAEVSLGTRIAQRGTRPLSQHTSQPDVVFAITDEADQVGFGLTRRGSMLVPGGEEARLSESNSERLAWGVVDADGRLGFGVTRAGGVVSAAGREGPLSATNNLDLAYAVTDEDGNVAFGIKVDGTLVGKFPGVEAPIAGTVYESSGDIFLVQGGAAARQLTETGDNSHPAIAGAKVRYLSSRRRGLVAEYQVDAAGLVEQRAYADLALYEQVLITGQSLAQGGANAAITTVPPYPANAFKFSNGPIGSDNEDIVSTIAPLAESVYETISTGFARKLLSFALDRVLLVSGQAYGGASYDDIKKGGNYTTYADNIQQVAYGAALDGRAAVRALFLIHGEADAYNTGYAADLEELLADFSADIAATNGQVEPVVLLLCQTSSASGYTNDANRDTFVSPFQQLLASESNPRIFLVGPKYHLGYVDHAHIDAVSERLHGEYYAKVYRRVVIEGLDWRPVSPSNIALDGSDVVIDFNVPVGPLVLDTDLVVDPGNYGFVLKDAGAVVIESVALTGDSQVTVSLSAAPPADAVLSYAIHNGTNGSSGHIDGSRGCLRDSDPDSSVYTGAALYNWCVAFKHIF